MPDENLQPRITLQTDIDEMKIVSYYNKTGQPDKVILTVFNPLEGQYVDVEITNRLASLKAAIEVHEHGLRDY